MDIKDPKGRGRPRSETPCVDVVGGRATYRRRIPEDLRPTLGEYWCHKFERNATPEHISVMAKSLALHHDQIVTVQRRKLCAMRGPETVA